jgi:biopolymer transport protein ExbD
MRISTIPRGKNVGFNMTPMIDVVFLLIIFFLVASHLAQQEVQMELDLPSARSGEPALEDDRPRITVNVHSNGQIALGGAQISPDELERRLAYEAERAQEDLEIRVRSDRGVPYQYIEPILVACARTAIWNVSFAVVERGE